jgi:tetratricopeptide (TPR) repeat protein
LLQESVSKLPENAEVQFHLGMTYYWMGTEEPARTALLRSLLLQKDFPGAVEAQRSLAILSIRPDAASPKVSEDLEKELEARPMDPIALVRLAAIQSHAGARAKAISTYETALRSNPKNVSAILGLARLYLAQKDSPKAIELAKSARKLAPEDPEAAHFLGLLAHQIGDHNWAFSLLQEAARKKPSDIELQFDLANAAYSVGLVSEAQTAMRNVMAAGALTSLASEAQLFLETTALATDPDHSATSVTEIEELLQSRSTYVPALMAQAALQERRAATAPAALVYEKILGIYPSFSPAQRKLVILYSADPDKSKKAFDLALKAREAFPNDAELAKACGIIAYRLGDFARASVLLRESVRQRDDDAELLYFLGATQYQLKQRNESRLSIERALALKLDTNLAAEAQKLLADLK